MKGFGLASLAVVGVTGTPNIVELAQSVDDLSTLVTAVVAGGLAETLSSSGPFTVFAPTNEAFGKIASDTLDKLLKPENKDVLVELLTNHVVDGQINSKDLSLYSLPSKYLTTLSGGRISASFFGSKGLYARACVVSSRGLGCRYLTEAGSDNVASNGIVHIIDGVLEPDYGNLILENRVASADIVGLAKSVDDLATLVAAVVAGDLVGTLTSAGPFTVFAPTNEGFAALPPGTVDSLLKPENKATLVDILTNHVLPSQISASTLEELKPTIPGNFGLTTTVEGKPLKFAASNGKISVGSGTEELRTVIAADNYVTNGIVHIIDGVMLPDSLASTKAVRLTSYSKRSCGGDETGSFDVMDGECYQLSEVAASSQKSDQRIICEPSGDAYILKYYSTDGSCSNERFIGFYSRQYIRKDQCFGLKLDCNPTDPNIVELAESVQDLSTLVAAVVAGDLVDTLSSAGPFTVFAPTNDGFAALPASTLEALMKPENKAQLVDILTYHVVAAKVLSQDLQPFQEVGTVQGKNLHVLMVNGVVRVGATIAAEDLKSVTAADNIASNGVVHIIDGVMIPPTTVLV